MTKSIGFVGIQVGDEGKAKALSYVLSKAVEEVNKNPNKRKTTGKPILVRRFQGGGNAGHTVIYDGRVYKLKQIPSGTPVNETYNLMGKKTFVNPRSLTDEIEGLCKQGVKISKDNYGISANAHITLDYHVEEDQIAFNLERHTSTGSGIKQTSVDKQGRVGIRFIEFLDPKLMKEILQERRFSQQFPTKWGSIEKFVDSYAKEREFLKEFLVQEHVVLKKHGTLYRIEEGAQGFNLCVDDGLYPGVTSSNPTEVPGRPDIIFGIVKLYTSSVGTGDRPFVSHIQDKKLETTLRNAWNERGTRTGKDRDLGWIDAVALKYAVDTTDVDYLAGTCGDRLEIFARLGQKVKMVTGYKIDGKTHEEWDLSFHKRDTLYKAEPVIEEFAPWEKFTEDGKTLTPNAERYIDRIQEITGKEFIMQGFGPEEKDMIAYKNPLIL